jgi:predicted ATPase
MLPESAASEQPTATASTFLERVAIRNYKSIGQCNVALDPLTVLVGRNGSGKSNFLDAVRLVVDALETTLEHAIRSRGGIDSVRRKSTGHPRNFAIQLSISPGRGESLNYSFEVGAEKGGGFCVTREQLESRTVAHGHWYYRVDRGAIIRSSAEKMPPAARDRLYLVAASSLDEFRPAYDSLRSMGFYSLNPTSMRELQSPDAGELLRHDGSNIASVVNRLNRNHPQVIQRIQDYLGTIVPDITRVVHCSLGPKETLEFSQKVKGAQHPWTFHANSMSDGTLRTLGTLVAVMQFYSSEEPVRLVGIEEPETALHPAAAGALMDALREVSANTQVVLTSHSPDLLDKLDPEHERLLVVQATEGETEIGNADSASRDAIRNHLYSAGDLLRMDQLQIDENDLQKQRQGQLFDGLDDHGEST